MCAMPGRNPYRPGVGTLPQHFTGREAELRRFGAVLRGAPELPANIRLTGLRGVGKTVLLAKFAERAHATGWLAARLELEPRHNDEDELVVAISRVLSEIRRRLSGAARTRARLGEVVRRVSQVGVEVEGVAVTFDATLAGSGVELGTALLESAHAAVRAERRGVILLLDEAQVVRDDRHRGGDHPLSLLLAAVATVQQSELPIGLVLAGLPQLTSNLLAARTYSERMFRGEAIGSLDAAATRTALLAPLDDAGVSYDEDLVRAVLDDVDGYPYFLQLWGAELWDAADFADVQHVSLALLDSVRPDIQRRLDIDFFEPRLQALTPAEQDLLLDAAGCPYPPLRVADLNARSTKSAANVNVLIGRLAAAGIVYRERKGTYRYTAPRFDAFLRRYAATRA